MPKRGVRQPIKVRYTYPPSDRAPAGLAGVIACHDVDEAAFKMRDLSYNGASGSIVNGDTKEVLATFTPRERPTDG